MTHLNIGAALGMAAWIAGSGAQVVTGRIEVPKVQAPARETPVTQPVSAPDCGCAKRLQA